MGALCTRHEPTMVEGRAFYVRRVNSKRKQGDKSPVIWIQHENNRGTMRAIFPTTKDYALTQSKFSPLSLTELCVRTICRNIYEMDCIPRGLPQELVSMILVEFKKRQVLNQQVLMMLGNCEFDSLDLSNLPQATDTWLSCLSDVSKRHLQRLNLSQCPNLSPLGLSELCYLAQLRSINLENCAGVTSCTTKTFLNSPYLIQINLSNCQAISDESLVHLKSLEHLKELNLSRCNSITSQGLQSFKHLTCLDISCCTNVRDEAIGVVSQMRQLKSLNVGSNSIGNLSMQFIAHIQTLEKLDISGCHLLTDPGILWLRTLRHLLDFNASRCSRITGPLPFWIKLERLNLSLSGLSDAGLKIIGGLGNLKDLKMDSCRITSRGFISIKRLMHLETLNVADTDLTDNSMDVIASLSKLQSLNLFSCRIGASAMQQLSRLSELTTLNADLNLPVTPMALKGISSLVKLRRLDLFGAKISDGGLDMLENLTKLEELDICGGYISDFGLIKIKRFRCLKVLNLSENRRITDNGIHHLAELYELVTLNLSDTGITAAALEHLTALTELRWLSVYGCQFTAKDIEKYKGRDKPSTSKNPNTDHLFR